MAYILYAQIAHTSYLCTIVVWPACARLYNCEHNLRQTWCRSSKVRISRTPYTNRALPREMHGVHGMVNRRDDDDGYIIILYILYNNTPPLAGTSIKPASMCAGFYKRAYTRNAGNQPSYRYESRANDYTTHTYPLSAVRLCARLCGQAPRTSN